MFHVTYVKLNLNCVISTGFRLQYVAIDVAEIGELNQSCWALSYGIILIFTHFLTRSVYLVVFCIKICTTLYQHGWVLLCFFTDVIFNIITGWWMVYSCRNSLLRQKSPCFDRKTPSGNSCCWTYPLYKIFRAKIALKLSVYKLCI